MLHGQARERLILRVKISLRNGANRRSSFIQEGVACTQRPARVPR